MINVLNINKISQINELSEFKFEFEFDNASVLPVKAYPLANKTCLIADGSIAKNISNNTYWEYNNGKWSKILGKDIPTIIKNTSFTENGNYSISNDNYIGYTDIKINVSGEEPTTATIIEKSITANGTYNASSDIADGYNPVNVNVPNSYTASDEGKVVSGSELVSQTSTTITSNSIVDTTLNNSVTVNVANSYTSEDEGMVVNGGELVTQTSDSYTINGIYDTTLINNITIDVSNSYTAEDEGKVVSNQELISQTAYPTTVTENNTYDTTNYNSITVNVSDGGGGSSFAAESTFNYNNDYKTLLQTIEIPNGVTTIDDSSFYECENLETITFEQNSGLESIGELAFAYCSSLTQINLPSSVTALGNQAFSPCGLESITIPNSVTSIGGNAFAGELRTLTFESTTPPDLEGDLGISTNCIIRVPQGTLSDYTSASNYPDPSQYIYEEY